ncbi:hypothetical protein D5S18_03665 [Nocardia panacis]|uniref:ApeI dehydratase-like domain-containing protein n=1 Tax=Nocardia panacis TaxID=2340916 RepID=A0A3A4KNQ3_9NOCA|nr:hypothetical protein [Nocardia panacis]RJO78947.1 hypothetical protein D5S18_03665 [Nocardia panacis]
MAELVRPRRAVPLSALDHFESISEMASGVEIVAKKLIRADDPYLIGHYPDFPIYPGVFIIESVGQAVEALVRSKQVSAELIAIGSVRFIAPVLPGDMLSIRCRCVYEPDVRLAVRADCQNDNDVKVAQMRLKFQLCGRADV